MVSKWTFSFFFFQDSLEVWVWQVPRYQLRGIGGGSFWCHRSEGTVGTSFPGCEFLPVFVHKSSVRDSSPCNCSFFIPLSGSSRILLSLLRLCDFCRFCRAFTEATWQRIIKESEMKRCNKGLQTETNCRAFNYLPPDWAFELKKKWFEKESV